MCCLLFFSDQPPREGVQAKGARGAQYNAYYGMMNNPNTFALGLKDAPMAEPGCCLASGCGAACGFTACWARKKVLETYGGGVQDFVCFQNYVSRQECSAGRPCRTPSLGGHHTAHRPRASLWCQIGPCCCINPASFMPGSEAGLCIEGCCCPMISLSVARLHIMDVKRIQPDPCDWQIIAFSNALQCLSAIVNIIAIFVEQLRDAAEIIDLIADLVTLTVAGCMGAQVYHEVNKSNASGAVVQGQMPVAIAQPVMAQPVQPIAMARPVGAPPKAEEMER